MRETVSPARAIEGVITLPGDKSISHRYGMLASIASGRSTIANYSTGADCQSTLACMAALGAKIERQDGSVVDRRRGAPGTRGAARCGQLRIHHPHAVRNPGGAGVYLADRRRRIALPPSHGAHHRSAHRDGRADRSPRRKVSAARRFTAAPLHGIDYHAPHGQRAGQELRSAGRPVRAGRYHRPRAGPHARPHRNRAQGVRRGDRNREADHSPARRSAPDRAGIGRAGRSLLGLFFPGRRAAGQGIEPGDPRRRPEPDALRRCSIFWCRWARRSRCSKSTRWEAS